MNNRIDVLAGQALDRKGGLDRHKFAELIVRECAQVADQWVDDEDNGHNLVSAKLKKHFGVE